MVNPILVNENIKTFVAGIRQEILYKDNNCLVLVTGLAGCGKSTLMAQGVMAGCSARFDQYETLTTNILYPFEGNRIATRIYEIQKENNRYDFLGVDEAGTGAGSDEWNSMANRAVYRFLQFKREDYKTNEKGEKIRKGNTCIFFCMPNFSKFSNAVKGIAKFWIKCIAKNDTEGGVAIIMAQGNTEGEDVWYLKQIEKESKKYTEETHVPAFAWTKEDFINVYRQVPTFLGIITWEKLDDAAQKIYSMMKSKSSDEENMPKTGEEKELTTREKRQRMYMGKLSILVEDLCLKYSIKDYQSANQRAKFLGITPMTLYKCEDLAKAVASKVEQKPQQDALATEVGRLQQLKLAEKTE